MAENNLFSFFDSLKTNSLNIVFWVIIAILAMILLFLFIRWLINRFTYNIHVTIYKEIGDIQIKEEDYAKKIKDSEDNILFHFLKLNKYSPVIKDKYLKLIRKKKFGIIPYTMLGIDVYYKDGKVIPMEMNRIYEQDTEGNIIIKEVSLTGIDYDAFNFLQNQIKTNIARYQKVDRLLQLAPYGLLFIVVIAFILGMIFYTQHIEKVAQTILKVTETATQNIIDKANNVQIIP